MVYCGKPSRGCQMCRTRRIKCDETKPTCLQCQKSRRQCPGYKDDFDLVFRNETQATERRAKRATTASKKANTQLAQVRQKQKHDQSGPAGRSMSTSSAWSESSSIAALLSPTSTSSDESGLALVASSVPGQLNTSFEVQAVHFFLSNWVLLPQQGNNRGYLDFLLPLLRTSPPDSHLSLTFAATGLAALANRSSPGINSKGLLPYAAQRYEKALKRTNEALRDPVLAKQDSTLASVLLLGLFEQITSCRSNLMGWGSHIDGAVALIRMRGKKQLRTSVGKGLFIAVRTQMVVNCTSSSKPPLMGAEFWTTDAMKDLYGQEITRINLSVTELRAEVNKTMTMAPRTAANFEKVRQHMRLAHLIVERYDKWETTLPADWMPKIAYWEGEGKPEGTEFTWHIYPGQVHSFEDLWQATVWNMTYQSRFFLAGIVIRCSAWLSSPADYRETPEYANAVSLVLDMLTKTIATIPFLLGWGLRDVKGRKQPATIDTGEFAVGGGGFGTQQAVPRSLGGFFALWPLFSVCCSDYVDDSQRRWATGRLRWITEEMGVNQAGVLSQFQLRLPSMVIKRDGMGISYPSAREMAKNPSPTANLPSAARPIAVGKFNHGSARVKVDEGFQQRINATAENQQTQQQIQIRNEPQPYQGTSQEQGSSSWQPYGNDEPASRYAQQHYSEAPAQTQMQSLNSSVHTIYSYSQARNQNQSFHYQNQSQYSEQVSFNRTPSDESFSTTSSAQNMDRKTHQPNLTPMPSNEYQRSAEPQGHYSPPNMDSRVDNLVNAVVSREKTLSHSSCSPPSSYDSPSPPTPQHRHHAEQPEYQFTASTTNPPQPSYLSYDQTPHPKPGHYQPYDYEHGTTNAVTHDPVMLFKVETSSPPTPSALYHGKTGYVEEYAPHNSSHPISITMPPTWNTLDPTPQTVAAHGLPRHEHLGKQGYVLSGHAEPGPATIRGVARPASLGDGGSFDYAENRLNWEIEMVGREVARGNEAERRHFQAHLRDLERQKCDG